MSFRSILRKVTAPAVFRNRGKPRLLRTLLAVAAVLPAAAIADSFTLSTLAGDVEIPLVHVDQGGSLLKPSAPSAPPFSAPTIFSAPLPSGSGARALGVAGAFTAIADDATAASWNPAGLTQLERPEFSFVYRLKHDRLSHYSGNPDYKVGDDEYSNHALNYMSAVLPLRLFGHTAVLSLNYQEVYDFSQRFHASFHDRTTSSERYTKSSTTTETIFNRYAAANGYVDVTEYLTTRKTTILDQTLSSSTLGRLDFEQDGSVQAITPAFAFQATPKLAFGIALNIYQEGLLGSPDIHSRTKANYHGTLDNLATTSDYRDTSGFWSYTGEYVSPTLNMPIGPESGQVPPYSSSETRSDLSRIHYTGRYDVYDRITSFRGVNATLGTLLNVNEKLTLGFCLDLPWTAKAHQSRRIYSSVTTEGDNTRTASTRHESKDVEFEFPLQWSAGTVWHWNNRLSTSFDVSQTWWSDYSFKADGEKRINPIDGSDYGDHSVDDCWALRTGTEYLWVLSKTEIPFRAGLSWEQRPAIGRPDEYWGITLGSGFSIGRGANKIIIDVAYMYSWGNNVMGTLVPGQKDTLETDMERHELYLSCIYHF
jgi:long-subunit fatty acid transport protein